jgi:Arc/MetJ-type ribon-helix-helix transcriptional regulator
MAKVIRPEIKEDSKFVIETLIERGLYTNATEVVAKALDLLFEKQIEEDVKKQMEERPDYSEIFQIQTSTKVG